MQIKNEKKYINHGLGFVSEKEHKEMITTNAIICYNGKVSDAIHADYPKLMTEAGSNDLAGNLTAIQGEMENLRSKGKRSWIEYFPRAYTNYTNKKTAEKNALDSTWDSFKNL